VIAPRASLIVDDVSDVRIIERAPERRHRIGVYHSPGLGILQPVEDDSYVLRRIVFGDDAAAFERRVRSDLPLTIDLVTE